MFESRFDLPDSGEKSEETRSLQVFDVLYFAVRGVLLHLGYDDRTGELGEWMGVLDC